MRSCTVRDFKNFLLKTIGAETHFEFTMPSGVPDDRRIEFWAKLNRLGGRNMDSHPPETVDDIDATVTLSEQEWHDLNVELQQFLARPSRP